MQKVEFFFNIDRSVYDYALKNGFEGIGTGGGFDYMAMRLENGYTVIICDPDDAGSPESLDSPAALMIMTDLVKEPLHLDYGEWENSISIAFDTAKDAIDFMTNSKFQFSHLEFDMRQKNND